MKFLFRSDKTPYGPNPATKAELEGLPGSRNQMGFLKANKLTKFFGGLAAVLEFDMDVSRGQIFGLIGPNGAGKSTALNMIDGTLQPSQGEVIFNGEEITKFPAHRRSQRGIARVFQENLFFSSFTVLENVRVGYHLQSKIGLSSIFLNTQYIIKIQSLKYFPII